MTAPAARPPRDAGQAFPVYIVAVAGLLFLALAFFAVGQAAASRGGAQTAADAAALAAGQKYRDRLTESFLDALRSGADWRDLLEGRGADSRTACDSAGWFAGRNDAVLTDCTPDSWPTSFAVRVRARSAVGRSVVPGTESTHAEARATAVVEPRCHADPSGDTPAPPGPSAPGKGVPSTTPGPATGDPGTGKGKDDGADDAPLPGLVCDGKAWHLEPGDLDDGRGLPGATDLFAVRLTR
ncbi:pilus assembly protein TadG-related protein [Streptomyces sp. BBFR2]|uniref:pilus assembly protein TadG-related protein n=1 Tax=Streptomyces sp. BBFR2 TaxID=3372854 RepID=UPI0037D9D7C1